MKNYLKTLFALVLVIAMLTGCAPATPATPATSTSQTEVAPATTAETKTEVASAPAEETAEVADDRHAFNLDKETSYDIVIYGGAWDEWWINANPLAEFKKEGPYVIGLCQSWRGEVWQEQVYFEFMKEAKNNPMIKDVVYMDSASDVDTQIANLETMFTMWQSGDLDGIILDPLDANALNATITKITSAGCPIILYDNGINSTDYTAICTDDPGAYGRNGAEWLAKELNYKGNIFFFRGVQGFPVDEGRSGGALEVFEKYPDIKIVAIEYCNWSADQAKEAFFNMYAAHPDFDGIYSVGGQMSLAVIEAMEELGLNPGDYAHASEDNNGFIQKCMEYNIPSCVSSHPSIQAVMALQTCVNILQGYPTQKLNYFPSPLITSAEYEKYVRTGAPDGIFVSTYLTDAELNDMLK